jgi:hypothetical protein
MFTLVAFSDYGHMQLSSFCLTSHADGSAHINCVGSATVAFPAIVRFVPMLLITMLDVDSPTIPIFADCELVAVVEMLALLIWRLKPEALTEPTIAPPVVPFVVSVILAEIWFSCTVTDELTFRRSPPIVPFVEAHPRVRLSWAPDTVTAYCAFYTRPEAHCYAAALTERFELVMLMLEV